MIFMQTTSSRDKFSTEYYETNKKLTFWNQNIMQDMSKTTTWNAGKIKYTIANNVCVGSEACQCWILFAPVYNLVKKGE